MQNKDFSKKRPKVLCLATFFNRKEKTVNAVRKLIDGSPGVELSFCLVDDGSTDGTSEILKDFPGVHVLFGSGNLFYSGGMRKAIDYAKNTDNKYNYVLLFNDDVDFFPGALERLIDCSGKYDSHAIWVGPTCDDSDKLSYGGVRRTSAIRPNCEIVMSKEREGRECDTFNANCVLIPWNTFLELPNIPTPYGHSMGDFAYGFEAHRRGIKILVMDQFIGKCNDNSQKGTWLDTELSFSERIRKKENPKGLPFKAWFYYLLTNYNIFTAIVYSIIPYARIILRR